MLFGDYSTSDLDLYGSHSRIVVNTTQMQESDCDGGQGGGHVGVLGATSTTRGGGLDMTSLRTKGGSKIED